MIAVLYPVVGFLADITLEHALLFLGAIALIFTFITNTATGFNSCGHALGIQIG